VELRDALRRRPVAHDRQVAIGEAILRIEELVGGGDDATAAIARLNETTGHAFGLDDFHYHCGVSDREQLVEWACAPPVRLPDVTRDELVEIVHPPPELRNATAEEIVDAAAVRALPRI
jgi:hypothetical protein